MSRQQQEYSLAELFNQPVLGLAMASDGLDRRSLELMLDAEGGGRSHVQAQRVWARPQADAGFITTDL